jgi:tetratricopeptide (TPR) repeat protein
VLSILVFVVSLKTAPAIVSMQQKAIAPAGAGQTTQELEHSKKIALEAQRKAEVDPSEANLFEYASSLMKLDYHSAEVIYRFAAYKYPDSVRLHTGLASALGAQSLLDEAAAELCKAAEIAPEDPHPLEFLVAAQYIPAELTQKVTDGLLRLHHLHLHDGLILFDYEMVVSKRYMDPSTPPPHDFVPILKQAIRLNPHLPEAYFQLSLVYEEEKAYAEEIQALLRAVKMSPQDEHYRYRLAMVYKRLGDNAHFQREFPLFQQLHSRSSAKTP